MAEESAKLRIPYIAAAQAQKHVTHNEGVTLLDTLVQLSVIDKDLTAPPGSPGEGDTYIVAASATGAWIGWDGRVARYIDGTWRSYLPGEGGGAGWLAWAIDEAKLYAFNGTNWVAAGLQFGAYLDFGEISPPSSPSSDVARLYAKDVGGVTKLAIKDSAGAETVLGSGGGGAGSGVATVRAATTANIAIATALNNADVLDGVTLATGDLVLVKDQSSAADNGVYEVGATPARASSFAAYDAHPGALISVQEGTANADTLWLCTSNKGGTLGSTALAFAARRSRDTLTANRTYYVRSDGSDSNTGLVDSSGGAFATIQKAINVVVTLDLAGFTATVQVGSGTFAGFSVTIPQFGGSVVVAGNGAANTTISAAGNCVAVLCPTKLTLQSLKLTSSGAYCAYADGGGRLTLGTGLEFGTAAAGHVRAAVNGLIESGSSYTISGAAPVHYSAALAGVIIVSGGTVTLSGTPAFTVFAGAEGASVLFCVASFSGSATGARYSSTQSSVVNVNGAGASYFPGNAAGSTATGGQYV
jgi:hypothetical protein